MRHDLVWRRPAERLRLARRRLNDGSHRVLTELVGLQRRSGVVTTHARKKQGGESVALNDVLDQLTDADLRRRRSRPGV